MKTILTCIIPFAARGFARDWNLACDYLGKTIGSLLNSEDSRLKVVVVGHDHPGDSIPKDSRVSFIACSVPPPPLSTARDAVQIIKDQRQKMLCGWTHVKDHQPTKYVMRMDADDFLSRKIVGFLADRNDPGFRITDGFVWNSRSRYTLEATEYFNLLCGSSVIVRSDLAEKEFDFEQVCESVSESLLLAHGQSKPSLLINEMHACSGRAMEIHGLKIQSIPFRAAIYRVGNVNSYMQRDRKIHSLRFLLGRLRRLRFLTPSLRREFALHP